MPRAGVDVVTGAFSYTGKYVTRRLLALGREVRTLTGHPERPNEFAGAVKAFPLDFGQADRLEEALRGADTLYNTYWVRFAHGDRTYESAVANTRALFRAAERAGVRRIVHTSIANPTEDSPFPYYRGKAVLERELRAGSTSWAILRPTVLFGDEDILINNIAWCLRTFPFFGVPGDGGYGMQPIYVDDYAELAVAAGQREENEAFDAVGPDTFTFDEWLRAIGGSVGVKPRLLHLPGWAALFCARIVGLFVGDVVLTKDEVGGLSAGLLVSKEPPRGKTRLRDWLAAHTTAVGAKYASELARHYR